VRCFWLHLNSRASASDTALRFLTTRVWRKIWGAETPIPLIGDNAAQIALENKNLSASVNGKKIKINIKPKEEEKM